MGLKIHGLHIWLIPTIKRKHVELCIDNLSVNVCQKFMNFTYSLMIHPFTNYG